MSTLPFSRLLAVRDVPPAGKRITVTAEPAEREALAALLGIPAIHRLEARFEIKTWMRDGLRVRGELDAEIEQVCVVSLDEFTAEVREEIDERFAEDAPAPHHGEDEAEHAMDLDAPDPIVDGKIDLGALAAEHLALGLDPYPVKPGAEAAAEVVPLAPPEGTHRPFAGLDRRVADKPKKKQ